MVVERPWNMKIDKKSWVFVISHEILPILPLNFSIFITSLPTLRNLASVWKICIFQPFLQNVANAKIKNYHGKVGRTQPLDFLSKDY